jgi:hypothetical protein
VSSGKRDYGTSSRRRITFDAVDRSVVMVLFVLRDGRSASSTSMVVHGHRSTDASRSGPGRRGPAMISIDGSGVNGYVRPRKPRADAKRHEYDGQSGS